MTVEKTKPKQLLRPITTGTNSTMNQSEFLAIICNLIKAREKSRLHGAVGFGFASHWLENWRQSFKPIIKRCNRNHFRQLFENCSTKCSYFPTDVVPQFLYKRTKPFTFSYCYVTFTCMKARGKPLPEQMRKLVS